MGLWVPSNPEKVKVKVNMSGLKTQQWFSCYDECWPIKNYNLWSNTAKKVFTLVPKYSIHS